MPANTLSLRFILFVKFYSSGHRRIIYVINYFYFTFVHFYLDILYIFQNIHQTESSLNKLKVNKLLFLFLLVLFKICNVLEISFIFVHISRL